MVFDTSMLLRSWSAKQDRREPCGERGRTKREEVVVKSPPAGTMTVGGAACPCTAPVDALGRPFSRVVVRGDDQPRDGVRRRQRAGAPARARRRPSKRPCSYGTVRRTDCRTPAPWSGSASCT